MTGFGRGAAEAADCTFSVEIRCVNHRGLDVVVRVPREYAGFEERLRTLVGQHVRRGRCELGLSASGAATAGAQRLVVDLDLVEQYHKALQVVGRLLGGDAAADPVVVMALPGVCQVVGAPADPGAAWGPVERAVSEALEAFDRARVAEGERLVADLQGRLTRLGALGAEVGARVPDAVRAQQRRLASRLAALLTEGGAARAEAADEQASARAAVELAAMAERADVTEELARADSHLAQLRDVLAGAGPVGRRCDFLAQELAREWATLGAKATDPAIAALAVDARVTVEQVREQVQNLE